MPAQCEYVFLVNRDTRPHKSIPALRRPGENIFNHEGEEENVDDESNNSKSMGLMELPMEILFEILTRLSIKSFGCIRCVSKTLSNLSNNIINSTSFVEASPPLIMSIIDGSSPVCFESMNFSGSQDNLVVSESLRLSFWPSYQIQFVFYDLDCFSNGDLSDGVAFLVNPLRGEVMRLPTASSCRSVSSYVDVYGICYDDIRSTYKIVRLSVQKRRYLAQVLVLGGSSWMEVSIPDEFSYGHFYRTKSVSPYGDMHWLYDEDDDNKIHLISFGFMNEQFSSSPVPDKSSGIYLNLIIYKGAMTLVDTLYISS